MTERELDQLLDAALPGYVAEAPDGLAGRVVERARRRRVWPWMAGLAAAAGLVVAMVAMSAWQSGGEVAAPPLVARAPRAPEVGLEVKAVEVVKRVPVRRVVDRGLTPREERLLRFVQANPEIARQVFVEAPLKMAEPVAVAPLDVAPISIEPLAASGGEEN